MAVVATGIVGGCTASLEVPAPVLDPAAATPCSALHAVLPGTVADQARREVSSDGASSAWGSPAIVLRCGVSDAVGMDPASRCDLVGGVGWYTEDLADGYRFTTIGRTLPVEVTVPHEYAPEADALIDLAAAIKQAVPRRHPCV